MTHLFLNQIKEELEKKLIIKHFYELKNDKLYYSSKINEETPQLIVSEEEISKLNILDIKENIHFKISKSSSFISYRVPLPNEVNQILEKAHIAHRGRDTTLFNLRKMGWNWYGAATRVKEFIKECELCQSRDLRQKKKECPLKSVAAQVDFPLHKLQIDITYFDEDPITKHKYIISIIDVFSKHLWTIVSFIYFLNF